tara:strand:- start:380 stop:907 length:528 start_codon:yes stop_codon:yes gene_type:complete
MPDAFLSPITITLGDEFQSVPSSLSDAILALYHIEESIIKNKQDFKLRYVLLEGEIDTPINQKIAYEMLGQGLTDARELLNSSKREGLRFHVDLSDGEATRALAHAFLVIQSIIDSWKLEKDYELIAQFLEHRDYKIVADSLGKTRSQIYKRSKTLMTEEYFSMKSLINYIVKNI